MLWRFLLGDGQGRPFEFVQRGRQRKLTFTINQPTQAEGYVNADDEAITAIAADGFPYLNPLERTLKCFRRERQTDGSLVWTPRMCGYVYDVKDNLQASSSETYFLAYSPLQELATRKCRDAGGSDVLVIDSGDGAQLLKTQIDRTQAVKGSCGIDTSGAWQAAATQTARWERKAIAEAVSDLTSAYNGYDLVETPVDRQNGQLVVMGASSPRRGQVQGGVKLGWGAPPHNVASATFEVKGSTVQNDLEGLGQTTANADQLISPQTDTGSQGRFRVREAVWDSPDVADQATLDGLTLAQLQLAKAPVPIVTVTLAQGQMTTPWRDGDGNPSWDLGDTIPTFAISRKVRASIYNGLAWRIQSFVLDISEEGEESVSTMTLAPAQL